MSGLLWGSATAGGGLALLAPATHVDGHLTPDHLKRASHAFCDRCDVLPARPSQRFTCDGDNDSPPLRWSGVPAGTVEVALYTGSNSGRLE